MTTVGERIKWHRERRGLTRADVARALQVTHLAVTKWETGETANIRLQHLVGLSALLRVSIEQIVTGKDGRPAWPFPKVDEKALSTLDERTLSMMEGAIIGIGAVSGSHVNKE